MAEFEPECQAKKKPVSDQDQRAHGDEKRLMAQVQSHSVGSVALAISYPAPLTVCDHGTGSMCTSLIGIDPFDVANLARCET